MFSESIWITGPTRSGKTTRLIEQYCHWVEWEQRSQRGWRRRASQQAQNILVFAANDDNRRELATRLAEVTQGKFPILSKTPLGFFQDEVMLFWPLLIARLELRAQFPLRLRPETEQELATQLWHQELETSSLQRSGLSESRYVRRILDLLQLAAVSGTKLEDVAAILARGIPAESKEESEETENTQLNFGDLEPISNWASVGKMLLDWRQWCLQRGLLTYGIICDLYWQELLPDPTYQQHLSRRYKAILADDVQDYPAIARDLCEFLMDRGAVGAFTYNPDGIVRLGLNADPNYLEGLAGRCQVEENLAWRPIICLEETLGEEVVQMVEDPTAVSQLPDCVQSIQITSRGQLLRQTAELIIDAVKRKEVQPEEIAVIAPGLDAIARYSLIEILTKNGIPVDSLNEQRPLISSPMIRALLTMLALVYPNLGRLVTRDDIAEMLVVLSTQQNSDVETQADGEIIFSQSLLTPQQSTTPDIDPVRAGLLADNCFAPSVEQPCLLPVTEFARWDRLGHRATTAYNKILDWLKEQRSQQEQRLIPSCVTLLDRAIQKFLSNGSNLPFEQLSALRELMETAQHYWEVDARLRQSENNDTPAHTTIGRFIQLLRRGTVTANPYPVRPMGAASRAVTLATIFQYRSARRFHKWHFWLDASSPLWSKGGAATLFGAPLFLKEWSETPWTEADNLNADEERLRRILKDLLGRVGERVYLCHSDLATNGQEQNGPLSSLVDASLVLNLDKFSLSVR